MSDACDGSQYAVVRLPRDGSVHMPGQEAIAAQRDFAELALQMRRKRSRELASDALAGPAWDILLDLFVKRVDGEPTSTSHLCAGASAPPSTALRYVALLERARLIKRDHRRGDARDGTIELTEEGFDKMRRLLTV